jgi:energy-coupling factor transporter ATP-binding protein EcfA2
MTKSLPVKHLSARVPWHDNKWNGKFCCNVLDNSFCRILALIDDVKHPENEQVFNDLDFDYKNPNHAMPCLSEKGTFMSPHEYVRATRHAWQKSNQLFKDFLPGRYVHKPYSFNAVPFLWMMKDKSTHENERAKLYELDYDVEKEASVNVGFETNIWVQHPDNQRELLDSFFGCLKPNESLIFFYAKHTPLSEPNKRVIVGVSKVKRVGSINEYNFPKNYSGHRSYVWDRCIEHTLSEELNDGFLLPYHEIIKYAEDTGEQLTYSDYVAYAPDFMQFSYAAEHVEHDTAIDALFNMATALKNASLILDEDFQKELKWIDDEVSKLWDMRGAFPGMGSVLAAIGVTNANSIAWEIEKYILGKDGDLLQTNPWDVLEHEMTATTKLFGEKSEFLFNATNQKLWRFAPGRKKNFYKLLSRCQMTNDQAKLILNSYEGMIGSIDEITNNPYLLYEKTRFALNGLPLLTVDKAFNPVSKIARAFPLLAPTAMDDNLDVRRVRSVLVSTLENASLVGHSLLPIAEVLSHVSNTVLDPALPLNEDILLAYMEDDFMKQELVHFPTDKNNQIDYLKLKRLDDVRKAITLRINKQHIISNRHSIKRDWLNDVNSYPLFRDSDKIKQPSEKDILARKEKAQALRIISNFRFSVLIGPAGSGKTTLLKIFESIPEIRSNGVLKLAPTGKARIKLGHNAKTIAQFLYPLNRYDGATGRYFINPGAPKYTGARTIIIDEASMLSEEQLAALFDAFASVDRIILVGDYRQLPPIGTGRPFVDIVKLLYPEVFALPEYKIAPGYAELVQILRQDASGNMTEDRIDVVLSRCFGGNNNKFDLDSVFNFFATNENGDDNLKLIKWYDSTDLRKKLTEAVEVELGITGTEKDKERTFNLKLGGVAAGPWVYFNHDQAERKIEDWQIISPVNGYGYGVSELNKLIQKSYRQAYINLAMNVTEDGQFTGHKRKIAKPKGNDGIVYGDKIINLKNNWWGPKQWINPRESKEIALNYIANGEIGIITGEFRSRNSQKSGEPNIEIAFSTQPGYSYVFWPDSVDDDGTYPMDLAYCITVHKAQGSGFGVVFFVLPAQTQLLSRELLYTSLTRQENKIVILHQGDFFNYLKFVSDEFSETGKRLTDLFDSPTMRQINNKRLDAKYVNVTERGEFVISKNEVIIANCLYKYEKSGLITYGYEDKLKLSDGRSVKPDFTIENLVTGKTFYWEHLGMMTKESYRKKWELKLEGYLKSGFVLHTDSKDADNKLLIITEEKPDGGIDSQHIDEIVKKYILGEA